MSYIDAIAKGIASKVRMGKMRFSTPDDTRPPHKDLRGRNALPAGTKSAGCTKGKHQQCYSLACACDCHQGFVSPKREVPKTAKHRAALSKSLKASWAKRKAKP